MSNPMIVGCDPSSKKLAFYALHPRTDKVLLARTFELARSKDKYSPKNAREAGDSCFDVLQELGPWQTEDTPCSLFIEEPVVGRGGIHSSLVQAYINGVVQDWFMRAGYDVHITHQSTWKAGLGISQRGGKDQVRTVMGQVYPRDVKACGGDGDLLDAAALARYGLEAIRRGG